MAAMPCSDPREVACLADAFDLTTTAVQQWELELIWMALDLGLITVTRHCDQAALDEAIPLDEMCRVIRRGVARSKDVGTSAGRHAGINFEGKISGGRRIRVKVSWWGGYVLVTVHAV
jgi:hypothetical protein